MWCIHVLKSPISTVRTVVPAMPLSNTKILTQGRLVIIPNTASVLSVQSDTPDYNCDVIEHLSAHWNSPGIEQVHVH